MQRWLTLRRAWWVILVALALAGLTITAYAAVLDA